MLINVRTAITKWLQAMVEFVIVFPLLLFIGGYFFQDSSITLTLWFVSLSSVLFVMILFRVMVSNKKRWFYVFAVLIISLVVPFIFATSILATISFYLISFIIAYRGIMHGELDWYVILTPTFMWAGGATIYFVSSFFYKYVELFQPYLPLVTFAGILLIGIVLLISNQKHLLNATLEKQKKPIINKGIKRQNRLFIFATIVFIILLTSFQIVQSLIVTTLRGIVQVFVWLFGSEGEEEIIQEEQQTGNSSFLPPVEDAGPSLLAVWLEKIMLVLVQASLIIGAIVLIIVVISKFSKTFKKLLDWLTNFLNQLFQSKNEDESSYQYIDEKENLFNWQDWRLNAQDRAKEFLTSKFKRKVKWEKLTTIEKIRYLYQQLVMEQISNGFTFKQSATPKETLDSIKDKQEFNDNDLIRLEHAYEHARYSNKEIKEEVVEPLSTIINRK